LPVKTLFYLPFAAYAASVAVMIRAAVGRRWSGELTGLLVLSVASVLAFNQSLWRSDLGHLLQTMQYVFVLLPVLIARGYGALGPEVHARARAALRYAMLLAPPAFLIWASVGCARAAHDPGIAAIFRGEGVFIGDTEYLGSAAVRIGNTARLGLPRAPVYVKPMEASFFEAVGSFLDEHTAPGEYVLAVPQLQMLYFFYDRRNPTRYAHYRRALEVAEEDRYIRDIQRHGTRYVLLTEPYEGARIGGTSRSFSEYGARVRTWILDNYEPVGRIGPVRILRRIQ
jgi:hypothetical protein